VRVAVGNSILTPCTPTLYDDPYEPRKHFAHVEPFQAPELNQRIFHVVLDMEKDILFKHDFDIIPHEIYRVRRNTEGHLYDLSHPLFC